CALVGRHSSLARQRSYLPSVRTGYRDALTPPRAGKYLPYGRSFWPSVMSPVYEAYTWTPNVSQGSFSELVNYGSQYSLIPNRLREQTWRQRHLSSWKVGVAAFSIAGIAILLTNIAVVVFVVLTYNKPGDQLIPVLTGSCDQTQRLNTWIHFVVNIVSTILLCGSNYYMQILSAPTRHVINREHAYRRWLDIGIPSVRNLHMIPAPRKALWGVILLVSLPLHLAYNSVFSHSWTRQAYAAALINSNFITGASFDAGSSDNNKLFGDIQANSTGYFRLSAADCVREYNHKTLLDRGNVLVVTSVPTRQPGNSILAMDDFVGVRIEDGSWDWMCASCDEGYCYTGNEGCDLSTVIDGSTPWTPFLYNITVDYCASEYRGEQCSLNFSLGFMTFVCVCNFIYVVCFMILWSASATGPLLTIGDAIKSFLDQADFTTSGICLSGKHEINQQWSGTDYSPLKGGIWNPRTYYWFQACSTWRLLLCLALCISIVTAPSVLLGIGLTQHGAAGMSFWKTGFGTSNIGYEPTFVLSFGHGIYQQKRLLNNILLANSPQLFLSLTYLLYNNILTSMLVGLEWISFAHKRFSLRVSKPCGRQRATFWLQLPYRYSLPLILSTTVLHWLASQAIFLDHRLVQQSWRGGEYADSNAGHVLTVGYSPFALVFCLVVAVGMTAALVALALRRYRRGMPLAGSCSAAISAACHPPRCDADASALPVKWGALIEEPVDGVGHCTFTSLRVEPPNGGRRYAGMGKAFRGV
ncbi:hypothetical protein BDY21DRAFT_407015, partial [Lineolata rhizophorae]